MACGKLPSVCGCLCTAKKTRHQLPRGVARPALLPSSACALKKRRAMRLTAHNPPRVPRVWVFAFGLALAKNLARTRNAPATRAGAAAWNAAPRSSSRPERSAATAQQTRQHSVQASQSAQHEHRPMKTKMTPHSALKWLIHKIAVGSKFFSAKITPQSSPPAPNSPRSSSAP